MFIQCEETPNPHSLKFIITDIEVSDEAVHFNKEDDCSFAPLAAHLFQRDEIVAVLLGVDFVTITKHAEHDWRKIRPGILTDLTDFFNSKQPAILKKAKTTKKVKKVSKIEKEIIDIINEKIRPAVAQDGGDIIFDKFENNIVYLKLQGACQGCPSATITLKQGIENMLKHYIPEVQSVEQII